MSKSIEPGCKAIMMEGRRQNKGLLVRVIECIGKPMYVPVKGANYRLANPTGYVLWDCESLGRSFVISRYSNIKRQQFPWPQTWLRRIDEPDLDEVLALLRKIGQPKESLQLEDIPCQ